MPGPATNSGAAITPKETIKQLAPNVEANVRKALGLAANVALSGQLQKAVKDAVERAGEQRVQAHIDRVANKEMALALSGGQDLKATIDSTARAALDAVSSIVSNNDYLKSLDESAKMLKAKYDAYVKVGFSTQEAFALLQAEIQARARLR